MINLLYQRITVNYFKEKKLVGCSQPTDGFVRLNPRPMCSKESGGILIE